MATGVGHAGPDAELGQQHRAEHLRQQGPVEHAPGNGDARLAAARPVEHGVAVARHRGELLRPGLALLVAERFREGGQHGGLVGGGEPVAEVDRPGLAEPLAQPLEAAAELAGGRPELLHHHRRDHRAPSQVLGMKKTPCGRGPPGGSG
jgi:hypothetical protein